MFYWPQTKNTSVENVSDYIQGLLIDYRFSKTYDSDKILNKVLKDDSHTNPNSIDEIQAALIKTKALEFIKNLDQERKNNRTKFDKEIETLYVDDTVKVHAFLANISRLLYQFRLSGTYKPSDVISSAYALGVKRIEAGLLIDNPLAWLRSTSLNVVRELRKKQDRSENPKISGDVWDHGDVVFSELIQNEDYKAIQQAFATLSREDREVLLIRFVQQHSWEEISKILSTSCGLDIPTGTARQRGARALKRLRSAYEAMRESVKLDEL